MKDFLVMGVVIVCAAFTLLLWWPIIYTAWRFYFP